MEDRLCSDVDINLCQLCDTCLCDGKKSNNIIESTKSNIIELGLRQAISKGEFGGSNKKRLSQMNSRLNYIHSIAYMRRITSINIDACKVIDTI